MKKIQKKQISADNVKASVGAFIQRMHKDKTVTVTHLREDTPETFHVEYTLEKE